MSDILCEVDNRLAMVALNRPSLRNHAEGRAAATEKRSLRVTGVKR